MISLDELSTLYKFEELCEELGLNERVLNEWLDVWEVVPRYKTTKGKRLYRQEVLELFEERGYSKEGRYTRKEFAEKLGLTYHTIINMENSNRVTPFRLDKIRKVYYTEEDVIEYLGTKEDWKQKYYIKKEAAKVLGVTRKSFDTLESKGILEAVIKLRDGRRLYEKEKINSLAKKMITDKDVEGMLTASEVAKELYVHPGTVYLWRRDGKWLPDKTTILGKHYYSKERVEAKKNEMRG